MKAFNLNLQSSVKQNLCSDYIGHHKSSRRHNRAVNMSLGGEMDDNIDSFYCLSNYLRITNITFDKLVTRILLNFPKIFEIASVSELIEVDYFVLFIFSQPVADEITTNKTSPTGNQKFHFIPFFFAQYWLALKSDSNVPASDQNPFNSSQRIVPALT